MVTLLVVLMAAAAVAVPAARADAVPFTDDGEPAWASGTAVTPP
jgi:hypothetical protein